MIISVRNFFKTGPEALFQRIEKALEKKQKIVLDFTSCEILDIPFLKDSLGEIIKIHSFQSIQHKVNFSNVSKENTDILKKVLDISKQ